ncbi:hypothetical protein GOP47_0010292 [Adiantum capillus-veneris]|uniref:Uncharacterized protein n=1 Tax=Adiantum capillus-veneris TaxID=13818 RepID=A0A9D4UUH2_ADICA|nr:hypothetical protein GOP47_0010292 [Adiantum capillus-veneris]
MSEWRMTWKELNSARSATLTTLSSSSRVRSLSHRATNRLSLRLEVLEVRPHGGIEKFHCAAYYNCARKPS